MCAHKSSYAEHSDAWIALKIRSRLLVKADFSAATTTVTVQDGVVTLAGTAKNSAQKDLTEAYTKDIDGVKSATNNIVVKDTDNDAVASAETTSGRDRDRETMGEKSTTPPSPRR